MFERIRDMLLYVIRYRLYVIEGVQPVSTQPVT